MALRHGFDSNILSGFNFRTENTKLPDGRVKATAKLGGKTFEVFETDERWAQIKMEEKLNAAVQSGEITLNEI